MTHVFLFLFFVSLAILCSGASSYPERHRITRRMGDDERY